jgi:hypothetical protein
VSNTHLNLRILNLIWKEEEEDEKNIAYLILMMTAIKTASLSDARELGVEKRKNKRANQRESRLDGQGIELKFPPSSFNCQDKIPWTMPLWQPRPR